MAISRRKFVASTLAGSAVAMVGGAELISALTSSASAASPAGDVVGKITVGYQGWFACIGDGAPIDAWWHWSQNEGQAPSPSNTNIKAWPDMSEYSKGYQTAFADLNSGQPATLFSSYDQQSVNTHFSWMQQNGCDTAALQRFNPTGGEGPTRDAMTIKVRSAAEAYDRKFYIMYDVTGWTTMQTDIKADWTEKMSANTSSSAYARQNGKPVVCIWGFGFNDSNHPFSAAECLDVVTWFKDQGCYVVGGVPTYWRTGVNDSRAGFIDVYHAFDMLSPWMVGRIGDASGSDWFYTNVNVGDVADCKANNVDYQPCVLPGDLSGRQRAHGDFMWHQFYNMVRVGAQGIYISMFDEYGEGNQIAKTAATQATTPTGSGLLSLDEDGTACSSDYYLRLTGDGGRMLKGQIALTATRPTQPVVTGSGTGGATLAVVSFRSQVNNMYVTAENAGASALIANRTAIGTWEQFDEVDAGSGHIAPRAHANSRFVTTGSGGTQQLIAGSTTVGPSETFQLIHNSDGTVSLLSLADNEYVTAENAGAQPLIANRTAIGLWEEFTLITD